MKKIVSKHLGKITVAVLVMWVVVGALVIYQSWTVNAAPLDSYNRGWQLVRDTATEDGANFAAVYALATNEGGWASRDTTSIFRLMTGPQDYLKEAISPGAVWQFIICGGEADNNTFSFDVVGWASGNGPAQVVCTGDGVIGTQDVVLYPDDSVAATSIWWADTINVDDTTVWPGVNSYNNGNNQISMLLIDTCGLEYLQFVVYDADGSGSEANDVTVFGRPY